MLPRGAVQAPGGQDVLFNERMDRRECDRGVANQIGQGRQAELDAFASKAFRLTVQRLVLPELLKDNHGDQARACPAARDRVERGGRLAGSGGPRTGGGQALTLAVPAGKFLANRLE